MKKEYDAYKYRTDAGYRLSMSAKESKIIEILIEFSEGIDPQGFDNGEFTCAVNKLLSI